MKKAYLLIHKYYYGEKSEHEATKELGVYSTKEEAHTARKRYNKLPGFKDYTQDCFEIISFELNNLIDINNDLLYKNL